MKYKKSLIFICLLILLFGISSIAAGNTNDTVLENTNEMSIASEMDELIQVENDKIISLVEEGNISANSKTFSDLDTKIKNGGKEISLDTDYKYNYEFDSSYRMGIEIKDSIVINGNGHTIDGTKTSRIFKIASDDVVLKNIRIKSDSFDWEMEIYTRFIVASKINDLNIINCSFEGLPSTFMYLSDINNLYVDNCNFNNIQFGYEDSGRYITIDNGNNSKIYRCNFINLTNDLIYISGINNQIQCCKFINGSSVYRVISIHDVYIYEDYEDDAGNYYYYENEYASNNCSISDCIFENLRASEGYIISFGGTNNIVDNCTFINNKGISLRMDGNEVIVKNCSFIVSDNDYEDPSIELDGDGNAVKDCRFIYSAASGCGYNGGSIYEHGSNDLISNCVFINSTSPEHGGAIYSTGYNLTIDNNTFINCNAPCGKSIFIVDGTVKDNYFDSNEEEIFALKNVNIFKKLPALTLEDIAFYYNNPINSNLALKYGNVPLSNKKIIFEIFTDDYHINYDLITNNNGFVNIFNLIKDLGVGNWNMKASYLGDSNYESISKSAIITVNPVKPLVILNEISTITNQETVINAVINRIDNVAVNEGTVSFYVGDKLIGKSYVVNSNAQVTYYPSAPGSFALKAIYENQGISLENTSRINVKEETKKIDLDQDVSNNDNHIEFNLPKDATGIVTVTVSSKVFTTTVDGKVNVDLSGLSSGNYDYILSYSGDEKYSSFTNEGKISIVQTKNNTDNNENTSDIPKSVPTSLSADDLIISYNDGNFLTFTLKDNDGVALKNMDLIVVVNDDMKLLITDNEGNIKIPTNGLIPKSYLVTSLFLGNGNYLSSVKFAKLTVKKAVTKLTATAKTFKKSDKTKKYTVTLKNNNNKNVANAKVTIKVNKNTYSANTNGKGIATFKLNKLTKTGSFKAVVSYSGNNCYNKATKTVNIKVK